MKVQVPGEDELWDMAEKNKCVSNGSFIHGFVAAIAYANEQLASPTPTKRPFLSDEEIDTYADSTTSLGEEYVAVKRGARWARDKYEAAFVADVPSVEPKWRPVVGQLVAAWGHNYYKEDRAVVGWYRGQQNADSYKEIEDLNNGDTHYRLECALIETLDEIGKPPSYFQERGRATV